LDSDRHIVRFGEEKKVDKAFGIMNYPVLLGFSLQEKFLKRGIQ